MESGRIFLAVLITAVSTYAAVTAWPAVHDLLRPKPAILAQAAPVPAATVQQNAGLPALPPQTASAHAHTAPTPLNVSNTMPSALAAYDYSKVKYARRALTMRSKPSGQGLKPPSLNRSPLTILEGTRLLPVREEGEWVMVQSPSAVLGWVLSSELTAMRPPVVDHDVWR
jgi:hypothetical protein